MKRSFLAMAIGVLVLSSAAALAQGPVSGPGPGAGPGAGPGGGGARGGMMGRDSRFGPSNTQGWSLMSPEERTAHRAKMRNVKDVGECKAYLEEHRKTMEARAKEKGAKVPGNPRVDMCERMQRRGAFGPAPKK